MKVSIITPSFNQSAYLLDNLRSVRFQTHRPIEHLVMDGNSTDGTVALLEQSAKENTDLIWQSADDDGQSDAINKGFRSATGDIIGWLNSDDLYFNDSVVSSVVAIFQLHPEIDIVYGNIAFITADNRLQKIQVVPEFRYKRLLRGCFIEQPAVFFRRHVIDSCKLDESLDYALDYEFWLRLAKRFRFFHFDRLLAMDRNHSDRKIIADYQQMIAETERIKRDYGFRKTTGTRLTALAESLTSGAWRRLKGMIQVLKIRFGFSRSEFLDTKLTWKLIRNQLLPIKYHRMD